MSLSISSNIYSLNAQRSAATQDRGLARSIERLSSGLRINHASDDAAGLAISERMSSAFKGMNQAKRNLSDATSMLQVADGAMAQVTDNLQRLRELAVQAGNGVYSVSDRASLQLEADQLVANISQIARQTAFNGETLFSQDTTSIGGDARKRAVLDGLKTGWLRQAERMVEKYYGIVGDGATLTIDLDGFTDGPSNVLAMVAGTVAPGSGNYNNMMLRIDMADFAPTNQPDGGSAPVFSDRIIAHEIVHAVMTRSTQFLFPQWFTEGTAEFIHGADERLSGTTAAQAVADVVGGFSYAGGYAAVSYMHSQLNEMGVEGGIKGIMQYLTANRADGLDEALNAVSGGAYANTAAFVADFGANGVDYINNEMDLTNADTGAIGGLDADDGPVKTPRNVVSDDGTGSGYTILEHFNEIFPTIGGYTGSRQVQFQVGASAQDHIIVDFSAMNAAALGVADLSLSNSAISLLHVDEALEFVTKQRTVMGAASSRLDSAASNLTIGAENIAASRSRILDADYAAETAQLTRTQILQQAATAMVAQANRQPRTVLALLG
jgi:flagellin